MDHTAKRMGSEDGEGSGKMEPRRAGAETRRWSAETIWKRGFCDMENLDSTAIWAARLGNGWN
jgi:hypothetical protein